MEEQTAASSKGQRTDGTRTNAQAIVALVLGILSFAPIIGAIPAVFAIFFGRRAQKQIQLTHEKGDSLAYAGWIFGTVALVTYAVLLLFRVIS